MSAAVVRRRRRRRLCSGDSWRRRSWKKELEEEEEEEEEEVILNSVALHAAAVLYEVGCRGSVFRAAAETMAKCKSRAIPTQQLSSV
jgi:hypothetical protein